MCYQNILSFFKSIDPIVSVIVSPLILYFAIMIPKKITTMQMISDLLKEFRSLEMGNSISKLKQFFESDCKSDPNVVVKEYENKKGELDSCRMIVSQFYQQLANLRFMIFSRQFAKQIINKTWSKNDLSIIPTIIIPIETRKQGYSKFTITTLQKLYDKAKDT